MRTVLAICLISLALAAHPSLAAPAPGTDVMPLTVTEKSLGNGLKVIVVPTGFPGLVSIQIPVQTGSRNEVEAGKTGFAHLFEHMMFRGTPANPPEKYQAVMNRVGARQNAYTSDDYTNYFLTFAKEDLEEVLALEADRFANLSFTENTFVTETRAVLGEYDKNSADPANKLYERLRDTAFAAHPYKHTTMGFLADIQAMPSQYAYAKTFFARWYRPELTTLVIAGDVEVEKALALADKYFGAWKVKPAEGRVDIPVEVQAKGPAYTHLDWPTATAPLVWVAFHGPAYSPTNQRHAAMRLALDLYAGPTSELYKRLVEREQKIDTLYTEIPESVDAGLILIAARLKKVGDAVEVRDAILKAVGEARSALVPAQRLSAAKSAARYHFAKALDSTTSIAARVAESARFERRFGTTNQYYRTMAGITAEQLRDAARAVFTDENLVLATLSHEPISPDCGRPAKLKNFDSSRDKQTSVELLVRPSSLPTIDMKVTFGVGSAHDPKGKEGLATLAAAMVSEAGSQLARTDEVAAALYPLAATFEAQVDKELTTLTGIAHVDVWSSFADVVFPLLTAPGMRNEDFTRLRDAQLAALTEDLRLSNDEELGKERLQANTWKGTSYAHPTLGTLAGVKAITLDDVRDFVAKNYTRANLVIGLTGKATEQIIERVRSELAVLPAGEHAAAPSVKAAPAKGLSVEIIAKDTRATAISLGHPIEVTRSHPDFIALYLARTWLGEHRSPMSHLYQRIREARGLNYGDYAYIEAFPNGMFQLLPSANRPRHQQLFEIWIRPVQPKNAQMALRIALYELERLVNEGMTQEQLDATRAYLMKNALVMTARQDQALGYALDARWHGTPDFVQFMRDGLAALTLEKVNGALKKHIKPKDLRIVVVTKDANGLRSALLKDAPTTIAYDAAKPDELVAEDAKIGAMKLGLSASAVTVTPVDQVFAR
ncbi:MAG: M16 family metallopeptidase [Myxococcota bacterium]